MTDRYDVLIVGGYGSFGSLLTQSLVNVPNIRVWIGGRDSSKAWALANELRQNTGAREIYAVKLDVNDARLTQLLKLWGINLLIHTCGPFQGQSYTVAQACVTAGVDYIDLADSRAFVAGIDGLDEKARTAGVSVISGASSVPALSTAVVDALLPCFSELESIETSISPGNQAPRGLATVRAILSYTGQAFRCWERGRWRSFYGWQDLARHDYGNLGKRWVARCEVPDLDLMPQRYPHVQSVRFYAGLELGLLHFGLWLLSWITRFGWVKNWAPYASLLLTMSQWVEHWGTDQGAMLVKLRGLDHQGDPIEMFWSLTARNGHGPRIPTMAASILAKKKAAGKHLHAGAGACMGLLSLEEFNQEFEAFDIESRLL